MTYKKLPKLAGQLAGHSSPSAVDPRLEPFIEVMAELLVSGRPILMASRAPTRFYKTGIVFLAYLNGHQDHFTMVGGAQSARSIAHLCELLVLADRSRLIVNPELAAQRMRTLLHLHAL